MLTIEECHDNQCWKFPQVCRSEAGNFGGGPGTFCWLFLKFMFMIWDSRQEDLQLFWLSFKYWWWSHQMEIFSALLALCAGNSPVNGKFLAQRRVTQSFDVFFDLRLNKWLSKQPWGWWFETPSWSLWRHCNDILNKSDKILSYVMSVKNTLIWLKEFQFGENKLANFG